MILRNFVEPNISEMKPSWIYGTYNLGSWKICRLERKAFRRNFGVPPPSHIRGYYFNIGYGDPAVFQNCLLDFN